MAEAKQDKTEIKTRIYVASNGNGDPVRLVRASSQAQVRDHLTNDIEITMASAEDVVEAMSAGIGIEDVAAE